MLVIVYCVVYLQYIAVFLWSQLW